MRSVRRVDYFHGRQDEVLGAESCYDSGGIRLQVRTTNTGVAFIARLDNNGIAVLFPGVRVLLNRMVVPKRALLSYCSLQVLNAISQPGALSERMQLARCLGRNKHAV